jgi:hypothetical protein
MRPDKPSSADDTKKSTELREKKKKKTKQLNDGWDSINSQIFFLSLGLFAFDSKMSSLFSWFGSCTSP